MDQIRIETVKKLDLQPGDLLHVKVGGSLGDDVPPYLPTNEELDDTRKGWEYILPEGVRAIYTHYLVDADIIRANLRVNRWPPQTP